MSKSFPFQKQFDVTWVVPKVYQWPYTEEMLSHEKFLNMDRWLLLV
jgi:hypothetical protein